MPTPKDVDIDFQQSIVCGKFVDEEKPTFTELMDQHYAEVLGDEVRADARRRGMAP